MMKATSPQPVVLGAAVHVSVYKGSRRVLPTGEVEKGLKGDWSCYQCRRDSDVHPGDVELRQEVLILKDEAGGGDRTGNVVVEEAIKVETESSASARVAVGLWVAKSAVCIALVDAAVVKSIVMVHSMLARRVAVVAC